jgi:hypothetical protein
VEPQIVPIACFGDCSGRAPFEAASYLVAILVGVFLPRWHQAFAMGLAIAVAATMTAIVHRFAFFDDGFEWLPHGYPIEQTWFWIERALWLGMLIAFMLVAHGAACIVAYLRKRAPLRDALVSFGAAVLVVAGIFGFSTAAQPLLESTPALAVSEDAWDLERAASSGRFDEVRALLASPKKWPPVVLTATLAEIAYAGAGDDLVRLLLARGADVNGRGLAQQSVLSLAAQAGLAQPVATLLAAGADIKATDQWGQTALHHVQFFNPEVRREPEGTDRAAIVDLLVRAGIPVDARDDWRHTPLIDNRRGGEAAVRALIAHGADVNAQDSDGSTPLMTNHHPRATEMLLAAGANPFLRDLKGRTVLDSREDHGYYDHEAAIVDVIKRWIAEHPADAELARKEAVRIGTTRIPSRAKEPESDVRISPRYGHVPAIFVHIESFGFALLIIVQLATAYALAFVTRMAWR